ncbi:MAG: transcriptional regulator [Ignisphaera sp.]
MNRDKIVGIALIGGSAIVAILVIYLLFLASYEIAILTMKIIITLAVVVLAAVVGWIGYTLATTPPPKPIEEIEKEIKEELKKLEQEQKQQEQKKA